MRCRHCDESIVADADNGWIHDEDGVAGCGTPDAESRELYAEPDAPACTGAPDLCGAPAGQPCEPGCPSLATDGAS